MRVRCLRFLVACSLVAFLGCISDDEAARRAANATPTGDGGQTDSTAPRVPSADASVIDAQTMDAGPNCEEVPLPDFADTAWVRDATSSQSKCSSTDFVSLTCELNEANSENNFSVVNYRDFIGPADGLKSNKRAHRLALSVVVDRVPEDYALTIAQLVIAGATRLRITATLSRPTPLHIAYRVVAGDVINGNDSQATDIGNGPLGSAQTIGIEWLEAVPETGPSRQVRFRIGPDVRTIELKQVPANAPLLQLGTFWDQSIRVPLSLSGTAIAKFAKPKWTSCTRL
jgi:hypothetical protein